MSINSMCTAHSIDRAVERASLNRRQAERQIKNAIERGKGADAFTSWERKYLEEKEIAGCHALAYNGFCYILNAENRCVTLYSLPARFGRRGNYQGKMRIRNPKKYMRYTTPEADRLSDTYDQERR